MNREEILRNIFETEDKIKRLRICSELGLAGPMEMGILSVISDNVGRLKVSAISKKLNSTMPNVSRALKSMEKEGHSIGIHTFSHKYNQIYLSKDAYIKDFNKAKEVLCKNLKNNPKIYRFPGGSCNCFIGAEKKAIVEELKNMQIEKAIEIKQEAYDRFMAR